MKAQQKLAIVMDLDPGVKYIDCMNKYYFDGSRVLLQSDFIGQGYKDLYMLANVKGSFSENEIGQIAYQLLKGIEYLHFHGLILRHLKPQNIVVSEGFKPYTKIKLKISDIGVTSLISE